MLQRGGERVMKVQIIDTDKGERYILLDDNYIVVDEVYRFMKFLDACEKSPNTLKSYVYNLKHYYEYMNKQGIPVKDLCNNAGHGPIDILSSFILWLQYPDAVNGIFHIGGEDCLRSNITVNHIMDVVLSFYQYLASNNEIQELEVYKRQRSNEQFKSFLYELIKRKKEVSKSIFKKPVPDVPVEGITREQFKILFGLCNNRRDRLLLAMLYEGGLRLNEGLGFHLCDITQIEDNIVQIIARENNENGARVKRLAEGIIFLPDYVVDLLLDYINEDIIKYDSDFLFLNLYGKNKGRPLRDNTVEQIFLRLSNKIGFKVTPHMLRHGFAQEKLESGWPMEQVQAYLRHKNPTSTQIYAKYTDSMKIKQMQNFVDIHDYSKEKALLVRNNH